MYLCQYIDVRINKSIKTILQEKWDDWILEGDSIVNGAEKEPSWQLVAEWIVHDYESIPTQAVRNPWMKKGYELF